MAAPMNRVLVKYGCLTRRILPVTCQQVRWSKQQGTRRAKDPHIITKISKWAPETKKVTVVHVGQKIANLDPKGAMKKRKPVDDVWFKLYYPAQSCSIEEAVTMHSEYADPTMLDNMEGVVEIDFKLNMTTSKKTKFIKRIQNIVYMPHWFDTGTEDKRVLVLCKEEADMEAAREAGAAIVGGSDLVVQLESGQLKLNEFDYVVATPDIGTELVPIRRLFRENFPSLGKGTLGSDVKDMVLRHRLGKTYDSKPGETDREGYVTIKIGNLNMGAEKLAANLEAFVKAMADHRPQDAPGKFISYAKMRCPPSPEAFLLSIDHLVPKPVKKTKTKKTKTASKTTVEEDISQTVIQEPSIAL